MTNRNPCYEKGVLWKTRTKLEANPDDWMAGKPKVIIPRGEYVFLLFYEINANYEETIIFLWKEQIYYIINVDVGFSFELNPNGANTRNTGNA